MSQNRIRLYALSTCSHCRSTKKLLDECGVDYEVVEVDTTKGDEREQLIEEVKRLNPNCSFPTLVIENKVIVGYREDQIKEILGKTLD